VRGIFDQVRLLEFVRSFCLFEEDGQIIKKIAAYHQFHAVRAAVERVVEASRPDGDKKGGVVWHPKAQARASKWPVWRAGCSPIHACRTPPW
jgi:type I restriction enzyme R subunit